MSRFDRLSSPKVSREQVYAWRDRIMSELEITGNVPYWLLRDILEYAGCEVEEQHEKI